MLFMKPWGLGARWGGGKLRSSIPAAPSCRTTPAPPAFPATIVNPCRSFPTTLGPHRCDLVGAALCRLLHSGGSVNCPHFPPIRLHKRTWAGQDSEKLQANWVGGSRQGSTGECKHKTTIDHKVKIRSPASPVLARAWLADSFMDSHIGTSQVSMRLQTHSHMSKIIFRFTTLCIVSILWRGKVRVFAPRVGQQILRFVVHAPGPKTLFGNSEQMPR